MNKIKLSKKTINKKLKSNLNSKFLKNLAIVVLVGTISFLLAKKYKNQFIVATVNYQTISRFQLNKLLLERHGQEALDELINQTLIEGFIKEKNINITTEDVEAEITRLKTQLGGDEVFEATLTQYGLTLTQLKERLKTTIGQKKLAEILFNPDVSDEEVQEYFTQNKALFEDKTFEETKEEVRSNLHNQKLQQEFGTWFTEQKEKASIRSFI